MKKALSLLLSLLMVVTLFTVAIPTAFAEGETVAQMKFIAATEAFYPHKTAITEVKFVNTLSDAPSEGYVWDVSEKSDGSVKAWLTDVSETEADGVKTVTSAKLVIGADGTVKFPADSSCMFEGFYSVASIDFGESIDTTDVISMEKMFDGCTALKSISVSAFETKNVQSFVEMFENCSSLEALDLSTLEIDSALSIAAMMKGCSALKTVRIDNWYFGLQLTDMSSLFEGCVKLGDIYIYDVSFYGDSKPIQHNVYYGVPTQALRFHDNNNIGTESILWERFFDDAAGATLVFDTPDAYEVVLNPSSLELLVGQTVTVTATVLPRPNNSEITWESKNNGVVTVKNGVVTAVGEGEAIIEVTNKTVDDDGPKITTVELSVKVAKPAPSDCYKVTFDRGDQIEYFHVSSNGGDTYRVVYGGEHEYLKGSTLIIKAYGDAVSYIFSVNGKEIESEENNRLVLNVNSDKKVTVRAVDLPSGDETLSFFDRLIQWFRDIFNRLFGWMN